MPLANQFMSSPQNSPLNLSVIIPVFNEEQAIVKTVEEIHDFLNKNHPHSEIIIINDGSTDKSLEVIRKIKFPNIQVINHVDNLGYGKSLYDGIKIAKTNTIVIIDSDGSYLVSDIAKLTPYYPEFDMVIGARGGKDLDTTLTKKIARRIFHFLVEYATGRKIPDINSGLRLFKKDIVLQYSDSLCTGFSFTTTITLIFFLHYYYVKYVPISYQKRIGNSKIRHFRDTLRTFQIIIQSILYYNPIKLFLLLALINFVIGVSAGLINYFILKTGFLIIVSALSISSIVPIFAMGLLADQLKRIYELNKQ